MDELLDALSPLASLLARLPRSEADQVIARLRHALPPGSASGAGSAHEVLRAAFGADSRRAQAAVAVAVSGGSVGERLAQADVLSRALRQDQTAQARLVLTVPDFLRPVWLRLLEAQTGTLPPRQTLPALLDLAGGARRSLVLASPYLNADQARALSGQVQRLTAGGGEVLVMTRLGSRASDNREALQVLQAAASPPGRLSVWAWQGPTLGVHFKVVVADTQAAYLGSANLTTLGALGHAEAGVLLHGPLAAQLESWLRLVATTSPAGPSAAPPASAL